MTKDKKLTKQTLVIVSILLVAGILVFVKWHFFKDTSSNKPATDTSINMNPPTPEEVERAKTDKQDVIDKDLRKPTAQQNTIKTVTPIITDANQYGGDVEVSAYVNGVFEEGGKCTATFKNGSTSFTKSVTGLSNVNAVNCPVISVASTSFVPKGAWLVTVSYSSPTAAGSSDTRQFEVK